MRSHAECTIGHAIITQAAREAKAPQRRKSTSARRPSAEIYFQNNDMNEWSLNMNYF